MLKPLARLIMMAGLRREKPAERRFVPWDQIRTMAIIIGSGEPVNKSLVDRFIADSGKHIEVYFVELGSSKPSFSDWHCLVRASRNLLRLPAGRLQETLRGKRYDFVLNACDGHTLFPAAVAALIQAPCKCATADLLGYANMEVSRPGGQELPAYLEEVKRYLRMIRT